MKLQNPISSESTKYRLFAKTLLYACDINVGVETSNDLLHLFAYGSIRLGPKRGELNAKAEFLQNKKELEFTKGIYEIQGLSILYRYFAKGNQFFCQKEDDDFEMICENTLNLKNPVEPLTFIFRAIGSLERKEDDAYDMILGNKVERIYFKYNEQASELWRNRKLIAKITGNPAEWTIEYKMFNFKLTTT